MLKHGYCDSFVSLRALTKQLGTDNEEFLALARDAQSLYRLKYERTGDKVRELNVPQARLKRLQQRIERRLLRKFAWPQYLHGAIRGRSHVSNARIHAGSQYLAKVDVRDFFPSITRHHVFAAWRSLGFSPRLAKKLTELTTYQGVLPQGAPASPALANLVLIYAEHPIQTAADGSGHRYTRFIDDIAISGEQPQQFVQPLVAAIQSQGFKLKHRKTKIRGRQRRQEITGCTLNSGVPSRAREHRTKLIKQIDELSLSPHASSAREALEKSIRGSISNLRQTNPGAADRYLRLLNARL